jgi:hypothetical protein
MLASQLVLGRLPLQSPVQVLLFLKCTVDTVHQVRRHGTFKLAYRQRLGVPVMCQGGCYQRPELTCFAVWVPASG